MDEDITSKLPEHLIDRILSYYYIPLKDVVRTSILSRKWRYRWATTPFLMFDIEDCYPASKKGRSARIRKLVRIIDQVLLLHNVVIQVLHIRGISAVPDIDRWILHASRKSVQQLVLEIADHQRYTVPCSLYTCESLKHLNLSYCLLRAPSSFKGFKKLLWLILRETILTQHLFESLVSYSPVMEKLILDNCEGLRDLRIDAPNLQSLEIGGVFATITFGCILAMCSEVSIDLKDNMKYGIYVDVESCITNFFTHLPGIKRLAVKNYFLKYLAVGSIPERLATPCLDLYHLSICINLKDSEESLASLCIFKSSPNLIELEIQDCGRSVDEDTELSIWTSDESKCDCPFDKLRSVRIVDVSGSRVELEFIKFLLVNSPSLEKMAIIPYGNVIISCDFVEDLLKLRPASARAEIDFLNL